MLSLHIQANQSFISLLDATEEWLYDEGEDQPKKVYVERLKELKCHGDPVVERQKEHAHRDGAFDLLGRTIVHYEKILSEYVAEVIVIIIIIIIIIISLKIELNYYNYRMRNITTYHHLIWTK